MFVTDDDDKRKLRRLLHEAVDKIMNSYHDD